MVIWFIGISGSGKTTLGRLLLEYFEKKLGRKTYMIDGDEFRAILDNDLGYTIEERMENYKRMVLSAYILDRCDVVTIVCCIGAVEAQRKFAREKIKEYNEIYLHRPLTETIENDVKGIYKDNIGKNPVVGIDIKFDEPQHADLVCNTAVESVQESFQKIIKFIHYKYAENLSES
jgi:adenylylsulfate kinase